MNGFGSIGMSYKRIIALPIVVRLLMKLHLDFDAFVDGLNHALNPVFLNSDTARLRFGMRLSFMRFDLTVTLAVQQRLTVS
jgi:hypothetical protein